MRNGGHEAAGGQSGSSGEAELQLGSLRPEAQGIVEAQVCPVSERIESFGLWTLPYRGAGKGLFSCGIVV